MRTGRKTGALKSPRAHACGRTKKNKKNNNTVILEVQTKQIYYDIKLTYLSF